MTTEEKTRRTLPGPASFLRPLGDVLFVYDEEDWTDHDEGGTSTRRQEEPRGAPAININRSSCASSTSSAAEPVQVFPGPKSGNSSNNSSKEIVRPEAEESCATPEESIVISCAKNPHASTSTSSEELKDPKKETAAAYERVGETADVEGSCRRAKAILTFLGYSLE